MNYKKYIILAVKITITAVIIFFMGRSFLLNWEKIRTYDWSFNPVLMTVSFLIFCFAYATLPWVWCKLLEYMGHRLSYHDAWYIFYIGNLGRYIPGKVWTVAGMAYLAGKAGIPVTIAGTSAVCAHAYSLLSTFVFLPIFFIFKGSESENLMFLWFLPVFFILMVIFIFPGNLERVLNAVLKKFGKSTVNIGITTLSALKTAGFYFLLWLLFGIAFWIFVSAVVGFGQVNPFYAAGTWAIAYLIGYLAFFAPGGLGVREGIMVFLLMNILPVGVCIVIAGFSRLIVTIIEILFVVTALLRKGFFYGKEKTAAEK